MEPSGTQEKLLSDVLESITRDCEIMKHAFYLDDGEIIVSTMSKENTEKMSKVVKFYNRKMGINNYFHQEASGINFILYRLSNSIFITVISKASLEHLLDSLFKAANEFTRTLDNSFHVPKTFKEITKFLLISQGLELGPEAVAWYPRDMSTGDRLKIAMKSMLLLTAERDGAVRGIPATIPFIEYYAMGVVFLFHVPDPAARGGAYDSCISILVDESYRPAIYENMFVIENLCIEAAARVQAGVDLDEVINFILDGLDVISFLEDRARSTVEIEQLMKVQLRQITKTMEGD